MKAFYKVKRAQQVIEPLIGRDSLIGLIFQLFEGLKDMFDKSTSNKGFKTMKFVEDKMLRFFEGDDRNPYFEAVYISFYHYYHQMQEHSTDHSVENQRFISKQIAHYLEKCLIIQMLSYGKYHTSVLSTFYGLGEAYLRLDDPAKALHYLREAVDVRNKVGAKDDLFDIHVGLKIAQASPHENQEETFKSLDRVWG